MASQPRFAYYNYQNRILPTGNDLPRRRTPSAEARPGNRVYYKRKARLR
jgi:hypothetical protein